MEIKALLIDSGKHSRDMAQIPRLIQADRAKFARSEISSMVHDNLLLGRLNTCEAVLKSHQANPYRTVDELIGDLQIILVESNNELRMANAHYQTKFKVEDLIKESL